MQLDYDLIQYFKFPPSCSYYKITMQAIKDKQKCPPGCDEHNLQLRNLQYNNKIDATISFCPKIQRGSLPSQKTIPEFNRDRKYYTSAFVLGTELKNLTIRNQQMQMDFQKQIKDAQEKNNQIAFPRPNENNNYCSICKVRYTNYFYHIRDLDHQERIKASIFNSEMSKLCRKYQPLWEGCQQRADKVALEEYLSFKTKIQEQGDSSLNQSDLDEEESEGDESENSQISDENSFSNDHSMKNQNQEKQHKIHSEQEEHSVPELSSKQIEFLLEGSQNRNESSQKLESEEIKEQREELIQNKQSSEEDSQKSQSLIHQSKQSERAPEIEMQPKKPKQRKKQNNSKLIRKKIGNSKRIQIMLRRVGTKYEIIRDKKKKRQDPIKRVPQPKLPTNQPNSSVTNKKDNNDGKSNIPQPTVQRPPQQKTTRRNQPTSPKEIKNPPYAPYQHVDPRCMPMYVPMHPQMQPQMNPYWYVNPSYRRPQGEK